MKNLRYCFSWAFVIIFIHVNVLVTPYLTRAEGFDSVIQHPRSRWRRARTRSKWVLYVGDYGAKGDGLHNDTEAFLEAWGIACSLAGFINLVFPSGETFLIYPVDIGGPCRSKIILTVSSQSQISHMLTNSAGKLTVLLGVSCILLLVSQSVMISLDKISS